MNLNPQTQKAFIILVGAVCVVASFVVPATQPYLLGIGGLCLGWAKTAPGDAPKGQP